VSLDDEITEAATEQREHREKMKRAVAAATAIGWRAAVGLAILGMLLSFVGIPAAAALFGRFSRPAVPPPCEATYHWERYGQSVGALYCTDPRHVPHIIEGRDGVSSWCSCPDTPPAWVEVGK
jgi:hypothetical protein